MIALLIVITVPVAIHLLARGKAPLVHFPSLRFVQPSRMRALRRRFLSDPALLAVRMALLASAASAFANIPLWSAWRYSAWDARTVRAVVVDTRAAGQDVELPRLSPAIETRRVEASDPGDGMRRAQAWLAQAPPGRREIVVVSDFRLGSIEAAAVAEVAPGTGLQFIRVAASPRVSVVPATVVRGSATGATVLRHTIRVTAPQEDTQVSTDPSRPDGPWPIEETARGVRLPSMNVELLGALDDRVALRASAIAAASVDLPAPLAPEGRGVVLVTSAERVPRTRTLCAPWMGRVGHALAVDPDLAAMSPPAALAAPADPSPFIVVRRDRAGAPLIRVAAQAAGDELSKAPDGGPGPAGSEPCTLVVDLRMNADSPLVPIALHTILAARVEPADYATAEGLVIADADLTRWSRPAPPIDAVSARDPHLDRRAWWTLALCLLGVEWLVRRGTRTHRERDTYEPAA